MSDVHAVIEFQQSVYTVVEDELGVDVCVLLPGQTLETKNGIFSTISGTATGNLDISLPTRYRAGKKRYYTLANH